MPPPDPLPKYIYKLLAKADAPPSSLPVTLPLSDVDAKDNFIHFSTAAQVPGTASRFFGETDHLVLIRFPLSVLEVKEDSNVVWDENQSGCFPHLYGKLSIGRDEADGLVDVTRRKDEDWQSRLGDGAWERQF